MGGPCSPDFPKSTITAGPPRWTAHYAARGRKANIPCHGTTTVSWDGAPGSKTLSFLIPVYGRPPERPAVLTCVAQTGALSPDGGDQAPRPAVLP